MVPLTRGFSGSAPQCHGGRQRDDGGGGRALQEDVGPAGQRGGHEGVRRALPRPCVHRPEDPRGEARFRSALLWGRSGGSGCSDAPSSPQAHWYNVRYRGTAYPPEIVRRDDLVERPVRTPAAAPYLVLASGSFPGGHHVCLCSSLGPGRSGLRHRDHQAASEVPGRGDGPDHDDLLHDRRTGVGSLHGCSPPLVLCPCLQRSCSPPLALTRLVLKGFLITNREIVSEDIEDFEFTPKPEYEGPFTVFNEADEVWAMKRMKFSAACLMPYSSVTHSLNSV